MDLKKTNIDYGETKTENVIERDMIWACMVVSHLHQTVIVRERE